MKSTSTHTFEHTHKHVYEHKNKHTHVYEHKHKRTHAQEAQQFSRGIKIQGWAPYGGNPKLQLSFEETAVLIYKIKDNLPNAFKSRIEFQKPL